MNYEQLVRSDIREMEPYTPIVPYEVLAQRLGRAEAELVKLDANENPYGPSPAALAALAGGRHYHIYPDPEATALREALSGATGVPRDRLVVGMGADELIDLILRAVIEPGDGVIDCPPSFGMYPFSTAVNGGAYVSVPRRPDFTLDVESIEATSQTNGRAKVLFLCSPNNPDGSVIDNETLRRLLRLPLLVVLDEAYVEFAAASGCASRLAWAAEYDNLVVLRTFSKVAGLAGLRVGYGAFPDWLLPHVWKIKQPYNVNLAASLAAQASLAETAYLLDMARRLAAERDRLFDELSRVDYLQPFPSWANFILCRVRGRSARGLKMALEQEGIVVRYFSKPGLDDCIRISAGRPEDTDRLVAALATIGAGAEVRDG